AVRIDCHAVHDGLACLDAMQQNLGLDSRYSLNDYWDRVIWWTPQRQRWQRRGVVRHNEVSELYIDLTTIRGSIHQLGEEIVWRQQPRQHGFQVRPIEQEHVWLLPTEHVAQRIVGVAGHGQEDTASPDKSLGDPAGELGDGIEGDRLLFPLGFEYEPHAVNGEGYVDLPDTADVGLRPVETPAAQQLGHEVVEPLSVTLGSQVSRRRMRPYSSTSWRSHRVVERSKL